jgi:RNA polymerase sporulation-specific sigma factor
VNTSKLKVLKESEKVELLKKYKEGDLSARTQLVNGNLRLVLSVVQKFTNRGENLDDLFQVGCIGLIKSIDNFDISQNVRFSTYAVPMIVGEIRRYLRDNNSIRVSRSLRDTAYKAMQVKERLMGENNKEPTVEQIAKEMGMNKEDVVLALEAIVEPVSLYEPAYSDGGDTIFVMDQVGDKNKDEDWLDEISLKEAIGNLGEREKKILSLRFFVGKTQMEVAQEIGISQAQVSRLEKSALNRIKKQILCSITFPPPPLRAGVLL